ncbi:MAG: hypothetical protein LBC68_06840, partial [Prevotellaceae bacterium]|nr:hypothetical protein [Prevotellaceae bacterium]
GGKSFSFDNNRGRSCGTGFYSTGTAKLSSDIMRFRRYLGVQIYSISYTKYETASISNKLSEYVKVNIYCAE